MVSAESEPTLRLKRIIRASTSSPSGFDARLENELSIGCALIRKDLVVRIVVCHDEHRRAVALLGDRQHAPCPARRRETGRMGPSASVARICAGDDFPALLHGAFTGRHVRFGTHTDEYR